MAKLEGVRSFLPRSAEAQYIIYLFIIYIENTAGTLRNCAVGFEVSPGALHLSLPPPYPPNLIGTYFPLYSPPLSRSVAATFFRNKIYIYVLYIYILYIKNYSYIYL